jgi:transcriptional regulator with XRE-family HTH domain
MLVFNNIYIALFIKNSIGEFSMTIGKTIKNVRKKKGLKLRELSERTGISISFLSDIENGRSNPSVKRLKRIADGLGTTLKYLLEGEGSIHDYDMDELKQLVLEVSDQCCPESDLVKILKDPDFKKIASYFSDYESWTKAEKQELLTYLKLKREMRKKKRKY